VAALAGLGVTAITVAARNAEKAAGLLELGSRLGVATEFRAVADPRLRAVADGADVLVSTIPADAAAELTDALAGVPVVLDAIYDPWPTPLARAVGASGGEVISGLQMLLHQAFSQVEQFTGRPAPRKQMAAALG
jgi:shikimate dehydrogenase